MKKIREVIEEAKTVAIAGHIRPDGDCVGSCIALYLYLRENFPKLEKVDVYLQDVPKAYNILKGTEKVKKYCTCKDAYDLFFALDCADTERLGDAVQYLESAAHSVCYDHHISNLGYAEENVILPKASSTSEVLYQAMDLDLISKEVAEALYMGIAHDTGVFRHSCTSPETMEAAAQLLRKGVDGSKILEKTFFEKTYIQNQILGRALLESILILKGQVIISAIKKKDMKFYGGKSSDLDSIVSQLCLTKGVEVALFLHEIGNHEFKVSMRSKGKVNVSEIAQYFGGGGHVRAAGCTMQGSFYDVVNNLTKHIEKQLKEANTIAKA